MSDLKQKTILLGVAIGLVVFILTTTIINDNFSIIQKISIIFGVLLIFSFYTYVTSKADLDTQSEIKEKDNG